MDRTAVLIRFLTIDMGSRGAVIELSRLDEGDVPEAVPLRAALRVQRVGIIVGVTGGDGFDGMLEGLALECRNGGDVEREAAWWLVGGCLGGAQLT